MTTKAEASLDMYTFGMHGDLPAILDRHHTAIAVSPRPMTIMDFEDTMYGLLEEMEVAAEQHLQDMISRENEDAKQEGREEIRDDLGYWKMGALAEVEALEKALSGTKIAAVVEAVANLKRMIERVQELLLTRIGAAE